jgi:hypothetical protein
MAEGQGPIEVAYCASCRQPINLRYPIGHIADTERGLFWHTRPSCRPSRQVEAADLDAQAQRLADTLKRL